MKLIKYPSIEQLRSIVYKVNHTYNLIGFDENEKPIYDETKIKPTLTFKGTVKLHGTNAGVCFNNKEMWYQSHKQIITPLKDNAGFAFFAEGNRGFFEKIFRQIQKDNNVDLDKNTIALYGEWAGAGIQKGVGINQISKKFFIIGIKISDEENKEHWVNCENYRDNDRDIYNIHDFKTYEITIDFNNPALSTNEIVDKTLEVEENCPVADYFGEKGIGEGIVFSCKDGEQLYVFKSKGVKHQKSKIKTLKKVDSDRITKLLEISEQVTPEWRLEQFLNEVCNLNNGGQITRDKIAPFIRAIIADVVKEEMDILKENKIEIRDIGKNISDIAKKYFFMQEQI